VGEKGKDTAVASCTWYRNGEPIAGEADDTLDPSHFQKGDEIQVAAALVAGGPVRRSEPVVIHGTAPHISSGIVLAQGGGSEVQAQVTALDADGDELTYTYAWYRNGALIPGAASERVDVSGFKNGDHVHAVVTAFDGEASSASYACEPLVLGSDAPAITSSPPSSLVEGRYVYQVITTQHEPGSLFFELEDAPAGMTIDKSGRIEWEIPQDQTDVVVHAVAVKVTHNTGGEAVQRFSITTGPVTSAAQ
jgi:hypothetical protein